MTLKKRKKPKKREYISIEIFMRRKNMEILDMARFDDQQIEERVSQNAHDGFFHYLITNHDEICSNPKRKR